MCFCASRKWLGQGTKDDALFQRTVLYTASLRCAGSVVFSRMFGNASCTCQVALLFQVYAKENTASFPCLCFSKEPQQEPAGRAALVSVQWNSS